MADSGAEKIEAVDARTGDVIASVAVPGSPHAVALSPGGKELWVADATANTITIVDTGQRKVVATLPAGKQPHLLAIGK